jgi:hypothetical protein
LAVRILRGLRRLFDLLRLTKRKQYYEDEEQLAIRACPEPRTAGSSSYSDDELAYDFSRDWDSLA